MNFEKITKYVKDHESAIKIVHNSQDSTKMTKLIDDDIKGINLLGGTKKVTRIVITKINDKTDYDTVIFLQSEDNGDRIIYLIDKDYTYKQSLIEGLSVYCQANGLLYSKI